jgi:indolepyruvate ferredoxin oxidoreductase alpha subunit
MTRHAFDLSEELRLPVVVRLTTRLAHSRADVTVRPPRPPNPLRMPDEPGRFVLLPSVARRNYQGLLALQPKIQALAEASPFNRLEDGPDHRMGIVACGLALNYLREWTGDQPCPWPVLKIGQYPVPREALLRLQGMCESLLLLEEGAPMVEQMLCAPVVNPPRVRGRLDGTLPRAGELTPESVAAALGRAPLPHGEPARSVVPRPPVMCPGCPHIDSYLFIKEALAGQPQARVFSDIGCYTLGALPPFEAIQSCVDMGASITMAKGAADAGLRPSLAVIGDSTFTHSGMTGLLDAVYEKTPMVVLILDNGTTGMTGGQVSMGSGRLEEIAVGLGVPREHVRTVIPLKKNHEQNVAVLREELAHDGVSVIVARRECIQTARKG